MDGKSYMDPSEWSAMLGDMDLNEVDIRDGRYNSVFHLVTAADGAEEFYTKENNSTRIGEGSAEAGAKRSGRDSRRRQGSSQRCTGICKDHQIDHETVFERFSRQV